MEKRKVKKKAILPKHLFGASVIPFMNCKSLVGMFHLNGIVKTEEGPAKWQVAASLLNGMKDGETAVNCPDGSVRKICYIKGMKVYCYGELISDFSYGDNAFWEEKYSNGKKDGVCSTFRVSRSELVLEEETYDNGNPIEMAKRQLTIKKSSFNEIMAQRSVPNKIKYAKSLFGL